MLGGLQPATAADDVTYAYTGRVTADGEALPRPVGTSRADEVPSWYTLPAAYRVITVERRKDLDLGDVELVLNR